MCETTECIPLWWWSVLSAINKHQDQWGMQNHDDSCIWMRTFQSCGTGFGSGPWQRSVCFKSHAWHATGVCCVLSVLLYKTRVFSRRPTYGDGIVELLRDATASRPMRCTSDGSTCSSVPFGRHLTLRQQRVSPPIARSWTNDGTPGGTQWDKDGRGGHGHCVPRPLLIARYTNALKHDGWLATKESTWPG